MSEEGAGLLLDTHVWIWLMEGDKRLPVAVREEIQRAVPAAQLNIAAISLWEVGMLEKKGRIVFDVNCYVWIQQALSAPGVSLLPLSPEIALDSTRLPGVFHGDPADRILVATARRDETKLVTADQKILKYAEDGYVRALSAS